MEKCKNIAEVEITISGQKSKYCEEHFKGMSAKCIVVGIPFNEKTIMVNEQCEYIINLK